MPDPVKAPPEAMVNEIKLIISTELSKEFQQVPMAYEKQRNIANKAINRLAYLEAFLKHNEIEVK